MGTSITLTAGDGHGLGAYRAEPASSPRGGVVIVQEIFGVNAHIRSVADAFAKAGYLTVAPALFDRAEAGVELAYDGDGMTRGRALREEISMDAVEADMRAAIEVAAEGGGVGVVGYCWGGTIAWVAACRLAGVKAAVGYYGGGIYGLRDEQPRCPIMLHFGETDASIPLDQVEAVRAAHPDVPLFVYADAGHGFSCDVRASYNAEAATEARARTMAFLAKHMG
jgi:carboxymethylenebutenolidase